MPLPPDQPQYEARAVYPNDPAQNIKEITLKNGSRLIYVEFLDDEGKAKQKVLEVIPAKAKIDV